MNAAAESDPPIPSRRELRARLFWVARWLYGGAEYHRGPIEVSLGEGGRAGDTLTIRPKPGDEVYDADAGPAAAERLAELAPRLLAAMLSPDALALVRFIASKAPAAAKAVAAGAGVERSRCYVLLQDLRERGLIRDTGDGYEVAAPEVWAEVVRCRG